MKKFFTALFGGAVLAYFLDPDRGARRRNITRDRFGAILRDLTGGTEKKIRQTSGEMKGIIAETVPHRRDNPNPDNVTLKDRVESEILRDPEFDRAPVNFNVEDGVVVIHGELETQADIDELIAKVQTIRDVKGVESYLHLPGTPAPNKLSAIEAS